MSDNKMLQAILDGQKALKEELKDEINTVRDDVKKHRNETKGGFKKVNNRLDMIGKTVAFLEDDALAEPVSL